MYWLPKTADGRNIVASGNSSRTANSPAYYENINIQLGGKENDEMILLSIEEIVKVFQKWSPAD